MKVFVYLLKTEHSNEPLPWRGVMVTDGDDPMNPNTTVRHSWFTRDYIVAMYPEQMGLTGVELLRRNASSYTRVLKGKECLAALTQTLKEYPARKYPQIYVATVEAIALATGERVDTAHVVQEPEGSDGDDDEDCEEIDSDEEQQVYDDLCRAKSRPIDDDDDGEFDSDDGEEDEDDDDSDEDNSDSPPRQKRRISDFVGEDDDDEGDASGNDDEDDE